METIEGLTEQETLQMMIRDWIADNKYDYPEIEGVTAGDAEYYVDSNTHEWCARLVLTSGAIDLTDDGFGNIRVF